MNLTRCENGHFYDAERFDSCPHCNQSTISTVLQDDNGDKEYTMPLNPPVVEPTPEPPVVSVEPTVPETDNSTTVGYFGINNVFDAEEKIEPVVGWLVSVAGSDIGKSFPLKSGRNFVGRAADMDVALTKDNSVSRDKHAIVVYEPKCNIFLVQPGDAKELFYVNDKVVLAACELNAYDALSLGETKLLFVPFCSDKFKWESVKKKDE